jgi:nucleoside-diphosphate kinase
MEQTLMMLKPEAIQRGLVGELLARFEKRGLRFSAMKLMLISEQLAMQHYDEHRGKPFFAGLVQHITSGPVIATVVEGPEAVAIVRKTLGATKPSDSPPGSIRGDFGLSVGRNLVHASDKPETASREIALFFRPEEIVAYTRDVDRWILE